MEVIVIDLMTIFATGQEQMESIGSPSVLSKLGRAGLHYGEMVFALAGPC